MLIRFLDAGGQGRFRHCTPVNTYSTLLHREQALDILLVGLVHFTEIGEVPFAFGRLLGKNMTFISVLPLDFTGPGDRETFFRTGIRLHLWHYSNNLSK
jgi:hypothetical protein